MKAVPDFRGAITFLEALRSPPWLITAIAPDTGNIETISAKDAREARNFLHKHAGERNMYYSVNPPKAALNKKAKKEDIAAVEYVHADLDPADGESPEEAKRRYLAALEKFEPQPCSVVDSGNGIQALWQLKTPVTLASQDTINDAEARMKALMERLGSVAGTQNVDRIMRLPGTTNFPNERKRKKGYVVCPTRQIDLVAVSARTLVELSDFALPQKVEAPKPKQKQEIEKTSIDWSLVAQHEGWLKSADDLPKDFSPKGKSIVGHVGDLSDLCDHLKRGGHIQRDYSSWSEVTLALASIFKADERFTLEQIAAALMCPLPCNAHVTNKPAVAEQRRAVERALARAHGPSGPAPKWREKTAKGLPRRSMHNARLAIEALGVNCKRDNFQQKILFGYANDDAQHQLQLQPIVGEVSDDGIIRLRQMISDRFGADLGDVAVREAVKSLALEHCFDPVLDMLAEAEGAWDGIPRVDRLAVDYLNADDTPLNRAMGRKWMVAAVRRARQPGVKFDNMLVLESEEGLNKSSAFRVLAGEYFSDESIFGNKAREIIEQLSGVWIHESAELSGLRRSEVEAVKALISRQYDKGRPAYGHFVVDIPRRSVFGGTTNSNEYLLSEDGNRRFWPLAIRKRIDIEKLRLDRLQLWGEAARLETAGESLILDESLWPKAAEAQENRRVTDPWEDSLADLPYSIEYHDKDGHRRELPILHDGYEQEIVSTKDILTHVLKVPVEKQTSAHSMRVAKIMKHHGWQRAIHGKVTIRGQQVRGFYRESL
jgi:predicted P-loop ATPase